MSSGDALLREIVDQLSTVIWMLDAECRSVQYVNPAYAKVSAVEEPLETNPAAVICPNNPEEAASWLETMRTDIAAGTHKKEYQRDVHCGENGNDAWFQTRAIPISEQGTVVGVVGISVDVTDRVERERELQAQVQRLEQFASMVSHDIRSPIISALASLELYEAEEDASHLDAARESLNRVETITADFLQLASKGDAALERETISLAAVVEAAWEVTDTENATLELETDATLWADESHLQILLENLLRNAVEHGGENVTVTVGASEGCFWVADDGVGIPPEKREAIFSHGSSEAGTGIGLAIVDRVATAHDWDVSVTESNTGGARFEISGIEQ